MEKNYVILDIKPKFDPILVLRNFNKNSSSKSIKFQFGVSVDRTAPDKLPPKPYHNHLSHTATTPPSPSPKIPRSLSVSEKQIKPPLTCILTWPSLSFHFFVPSLPFSPSPSRLQSSNLTRMLLLTLSLSLPLSESPNESDSSHFQFL